MESGQARHVSIRVLDNPHREALEKAVSRILSTEIAEQTYAQIVDGLPLDEVASDVDPPPDHEHPIYLHKELCAGSLETTREFRDKFSLDTLEFDSTLLFEYLSAAPDSQAFNTGLIELLAVTVHQIAVTLFRLDLSQHKQDGITEWAPPKSDEFYWKWNPNGPPPTMFVHEWYKDHEQYPNGVADMVGFWAESRIFGGVVLFNRHDRDHSDAVYLHPSRSGLTYRICRLLPEQKQALTQFATGAESCSSPLPILVNKDNKDRVDPEEPIEETGVFRNIWERKYQSFTGWDTRLRDVWDTFDFPTREDWYQAGMRAQRRRDEWIRQSAREYTESQMEDLEQDEFAK